MSEEVKFLARNVEILTKNIAGTIKMCSDLVIRVQRLEAESLARKPIGQGASIIGDVLTQGISNMTSLRQTPWQCTKCFNTWHQYATAGVCQHCDVHHPSDPVDDRNVEALMQVNASLEADVERLRAEISKLLQENDHEADERVRGERDAARAAHAAAVALLREVREDEDIELAMSGLKLGDRIDDYLKNYQASL